MTLETAAGLVRARATCANGKCERVTLDMTPSFADQLDAVVDVPGLGKVTVDIGCRVHRSIDKQLDVRHPEIEGLEGIS